jgi:predicted GNAT family acetyltransferase
MEPTVHRREDTDRYELIVGGTVASFAEFHDDDGTVTMPHTVTLAPFRGRGYAAMVVRAALEDILADGKTVVPSCWYVAAFIDANPEYQDLLAEAS